METTNATTSVKKIDLAAKAIEYTNRVRNEKKQAAVYYVETALIPHLVNLAESGTRFVIITPPSGLVLKDIIEVLHKKAECQATINGLRGRINISW